MQGGGRGAGGDGGGAWKKKEKVEVEEEDELEMEMRRTWRLRRIGKRRVVLEKESRRPELLAEEGI